MPLRLPEKTIMLGAPVPIAAIHRLTESLGNTRMILLAIEAVRDRRPTANHGRDQAELFVDRPFFGSARSTD